MVLSVWASTNSVSESQVLHATGIVNTNVALSNEQLHAVHSSLKETIRVVLPESLEELDWNRHRSAPASTKVNPFWLRPKFQTWCSTTESSLCLIRGSYQSRFPVKIFCLDLAWLMLEAKVPVLWALKPSSVTCLENSSTEEVMKCLVVQALSIIVGNRNRQGLREEQMSDLRTKFQAASTLLEWVETLGLVLSLCQMPEICILIDCHVLSTAEQETSASQFDLAQALLTLQQRLRNRHCITVIKTLLVSYGGALFDGEEASKFADILIPVAYGKAKAGSLAQRRRTVGRVVAGRLNIRSRLETKNSFM
jgi:hypothetical protein